MQMLAGTSVWCRVGARTQPSCTDAQPSGPENMSYNFSVSIKAGAAAVCCILACTRCIRATSVNVLKQTETGVHFTPSTICSCQPHPWLPACQPESNNDAVWKQVQTFADCCYDSLHQPSSSVDLYRISQSQCWDDPNSNATKCINCESPADSPLLKIVICNALDVSRVP